MDVRKDQLDSASIVMEMDSSRAPNTCQNSKACMGRLKKQKYKCSFQVIKKLRGTYPAAYLPHNQGSGD